MSVIKLQSEPAEEPTPAATPSSDCERLKSIGLFRNYALAGAAGFLLLSLIELVDLNIKLTPVFNSFSDRLVLAAYASLNLFVGAIIGALIWLFARLLSLVKNSLVRLLAPIQRLPSLHNLVAGLLVTGLAAILLNQYPRINQYVIGLIRELEKFDALRNTLLNHERAASYLLIYGFLIAASLLWMISRLLSPSRGLRALWMVALITIIAFAYYVDSRVEVLLYEYSLHQSMYLLNAAAAIAFMTSLYFFNSGWQARLTPSIKQKPLFIIALLLFVSALGFTFVHFGSDHNLKTQVFFRSTQAKQNFKIVWYLLDFDRDGYSRLLDGGDADDFNAAINPDAIEQIGDGIDNNGLGGDLTKEEVARWRDESLAERPLPNPSARKFNVLYFFIDTVRADHLSAYGYPRKTTPNIDKLAERSTVFEYGFSPAARTAEAIPRFMQSSYWDANIDSWTEILMRNGYSLSLFPGRRAWDRYKKMFPIIIKESKGKPLKENIDIVIEKLSAEPKDQPFCAYVYVPDPHLPYIKHANFDFGPSKSDLYDGELAYTDYHLGRLFDWMQQTGRFEDTMVIIMSDHGESLGERDVYRHASQLYNEQTRVPMIVYVPNLPPRRVREVVSTIDLGATILDVNGIEYPNSYVGVGLLPLMRGESLAHPPIYAEQTFEEKSHYVRPEQQVNPERKKYMVVSPDHFKMIFNRDVFTFELYDLQNDPKEERNLYNRLPEKAAEMKRLVLRYVDLLTALRPPEADEGRYSRTSGADGDKVED